jgi:ferredoxin-like protein FixX
MAIHTAKCDKCRYRERLHDSLRTYALPDGSTVTIQRELVWCGACRAVCWGERLADLAGLEQELAACEARDALIMEKLSALVNRHNPFEEVLSRHTQALWSRIGWRRKRASPPRCLECGATDILVLPRSQTRSGRDKWTLAGHPGCGGVIVVLQEPILSLNREWLHYSAEGEGARNAWAEGSARIDHA